MIFFLKHNCDIQPLINITMNKRNVFTILSILIFSIARGAEVKIQIENGTNQDVTVMIGLVEGIDALPRSYKSMFQLRDSGIESKKTYHNNNIGKGTSVFIYAILSKGGKTRTQEFLINKRVFSDNMLLLVTTEEIDDEKSISDIMSKFKDFTNVKSKYHETIDIGRDEAFKSIFGSMIITDRDSNIIMRITSKSLKSNRSDYKLTGQDFSTQKDFKREAIIKLNGNIPLSADLSFMFGNSELTSFSWNIKNAGFIPWSHEDGKTEIDLFYQNLDSLTLNYLADLYLIDSTIHMYFIDRAYLIESYNLKSSSFKKLTSDTEINVTIYGSGSSNFIRSNEASLEVTKTNIVTDIWGSDHTHLLRQNSKAKLDKLKKTATIATDVNTLTSIYDLLQQYDHSLPNNKFSNPNSLKKVVLENIKQIDDSINME
jgi:hypothetical protein